MKQFNTVINRPEGYHHYTVIIAITAEPCNLLLYIAETRLKKNFIQNLPVYMRGLPTAHARKLL